MVDNTSLTELEKQLLDIQKHHHQANKTIETVYRSLIIELNKHIPSLQGFMNDFMSSTETSWRYTSPEGRLFLIDNKSMMSILTKKVSFYDVMALIDSQIPEDKPRVFSLESDFVLLLGWQLDALPEDLIDDVIKADRLLSQMTELITKPVVAIKLE